MLKCSAVLQPPCTNRLKKTYKEVFEDEDLNMMASSGYEGYVAEGLDLGQTFDPEDKTNHRYVYHVEETDWQVWNGCGSVKWEGPGGGGRGNQVGLGGGEGLAGRMLNPAVVCALAPTP